MRFTTPVDIPKSNNPLTHESPILMLGSCFTDNIGERLVTDGFPVSVNPMGVLFNPMSIARVLNKALAGETYQINDLVDFHGIWHCLDFASRRQGLDAHMLLDSINADFKKFAQSVRQAETWIITFGTSWVFNFRETDTVVGNCHKLPIEYFLRRRLSVEEIVNTWKPLVHNRRVIFTVSPVRHLADGLHGNSISKSALMLAVDELCANYGAEYFPAYEIVNDELRDYRFYAPDMKHPSEVAVDYIYEKFANTYFSPKTKLKALECRQDVLRQNHRPIL